MRSTSADRSIYGYYNGIAWGFGNLWGFPEPVEHLKERRDVEALLLLLEDPGRRIASAAAETLAQFGERRAVEPLYRRLHAMGRGPFEEPEWSEWTHLSVALAWLEGLGSPWADELLALLELGDSRVGWSAGFLLAKMGDRRAIDPIVRCLATADPAATNTPDIVDEDWKWDNLVPALGELKAVEGVDVLSAVSSP